MRAISEAQRNFMIKELREVILDLKEIKGTEITHIVLINWETKLSEILRIIL